MRYRGHVVRHLVSKGSKSERQAVLLATDQGEFTLRRRGGNAFHDPELEQLVGKQIECDGVAAGPTLIISDYRVLNG